MSRRPGLPLALAATILATALLRSPLSQFLARTADQAAAPPGTSQPQLAISRAHFVLERRDGEAWELISDQAASTGPGGETLALVGVEAVFRQAGAEALRVTASRGSFETTRQELRLEPDVQGRAASGYRIETPLLSFLVRDQQIVGGGPVLVEGPGFTINGQGLLYRLDTGALTVTGRLSCQAR
ncbi:MAG: LPS export ABC transporter periplasmic protein LptC [Thermodesulfobacteriota bacterium]